MPTSLATIIVAGRVAVVDPQDKQQLRAGHVRRARRSNRVDSKHC